MNRSLLKELLRYRKMPCVTVIASTGLKSFNDRETFGLKIRNLLAEVTRQVEEKYDAPTAEELSTRTMALADDIDLNRAHQGLGIFVSEGYGRLIYFPMAVSDKINVGRSFEIRDVIANLDHLKPYFVLLLSKSETRLFHSNGENFFEANDTNFPREYKEKFQFEKARSGVVYAREESKIDQSRLEGFFREIDHSLKEYLSDEGLILMGVEKYLSTFKRISKHQNSIFGEVKGNYDKHSIADIQRLVSPVLESYFSQYEQTVLEKAREALFLNQAVSGIQQCWDLAQQGMGSELVVERDFACKAYLRASYRELVLEGKPEEANTEIADAVEDIIDRLLEQQQTQIHFVKNDALKDYSRIILIARY